jgi:hypothetical protein
VPRRRAFSLLEQLVKAEHVAARYHDAWGANTRSRGNLVLVDEPTEEIAPPNVRHDANLRDRRSSLGSQELKPSMRPLPVVVLHVGPQNLVQVPGAEDQLPVQTVGAQRLHPAL